MLNNISHSQLFSHSVLLESFLRISYLANGCGAQNYVALTINNKTKKKQTVYPKDVFLNVHLIVQKH